MDADSLTCPACGGRLEVASPGGGRRYLCLTCKLVMLGLPVLRAVAGEKLEITLWRASETAAPGSDRCPYCTNPLRQVTAGPVDPDRVPVHAGVCRPCEMLAFAAGDWAALTVDHRPANGSAPATDDLRCPNCGAPREAAPDNTCRYCHQPFSVEPAVVFVPTPSADLGFNSSYI